METREIKKNTLFTTNVSWFRKFYLTLYMVFLAFLPLGSMMLIMLPLLPRQDRRLLNQLLIWLTSSTTRSLVILIWTLTYTLILIRYSFQQLPYWINEIQHGEIMTKILSLVM